MIIIMALSFIVQTMLQSRFNRYSKVGLPNGMSGAEVAQKMLYDNGIYDVKIVPARGMLTDHYNPQTKTVALSEGVYAGRSVAAAAVATHKQQGSSRRNRHDEREQLLRRCNLEGKHSVLR